MKGGRGTRAVWASPRKLFTGLLSSSKAGRALSYRREVRYERVRGEV